MIHKLTTATPYTELFGPFDENDTSRHSFAAVNGAGGFRCYFDEIFGKSAVDRLYLLGGGPGSGKSTLDRLGGRVYVRLGIRYLEGSEQCQNNQCLFHDYWYLVVSKYTILEESPRSPQQPFPVRHHLSRQSRWRRSSHRS